LSNMATSESVKPLFKGIYYMLPDLAKLTEIRFELLSKAQHFEPMTLAVIITYVLAYIVLLLSLATLITERREFN
jgi:hypothetical protein